MSADPTTTPARPADPVVAFTVANRTTLAYALLAAGLIALGVGVYFTYKAWPAATQTKDADKDKDADKPDLLKDKEKETAALTGQTGSVLWAIVGFMLAVVFLGVGLLLYAGMPRPALALRRASSIQDRTEPPSVGVPEPTLAQQETDARIVLLALGGLTGLTLMVGAVYVLVTSFKDLVEWVDKQAAPEGAVKLVAALLAFLVGAGLAFLATQPARAEERNNPRIRRLVYGTNVALLAILVLIVLVGGNVLAALKVPARLDTTETGFHSLTLSEPTREYLANLSQPVTSYTTYTEDAGQPATDVRRMLAAMHDVNPAMFRVRYLSPTVNRTEIEALRNRFPQAAEANLNGVLLTVGEDEKQYVFIRTADLLEREFSNPRRPAVIFQGERKVIGELLFLSENKTRPVVYFLTGHGELEVAPAPPGGDVQAQPRPATKLRATLDKASLDVRPLALERSNPKVPDDAAVVVVADPRSPLPADQVEALRKYLSPSTPGGKKGKLIVMASPAPGPGGTGVIDPNLNGLLAEFGVGLGGRYLYAEPVDVGMPLGFTDQLAGVGREVLESRNPIATEYARRPMVLWNCQEVQVARTPPTEQYAAKALFVTTPRDRITWLEESPVANPERTLTELEKDTNLARQKRATNTSGRVIAAVVSEGATGRVAVFGSGDAFADDARRGAVVDLNARLVAATVNWLRDRPPVANIATKPYGFYQPNEKTSDVQVFWLPVGVTLMGVIALGFGVWVFRRK